ncbi:hypothetical protein QBC47DRAFT_377236 [Echria macrotheca]|uniref:Chromo domain-containing protein n=1 Tax=Echria macrotheca TaxID=438768 RepID=A0AAJ0BHB1_9PEZI|nr:hypothetical protein QBC47DRAFT_377236 [Echria macrotheca]
MPDKRLRPRRKVEIEIPVPPVARYVPGSGPPLAPISLLPPHDSTAYIIDQYVLPPIKDTKEDSRRILYYHVGFTDLPTVKIMIPCNKVLDYVSPRELEEWEAKNMDRNEAERALILQEKKRLAGAGKVPGRVGRPRKVPLQSPAPTVSATEDTIALAKAVAGPSLSTPQKRKLLGAFVDEEEGGETSHVEESDGAGLPGREQSAESDESGMEEEGSEDDMDQERDSVDQLPSVSFRTSALGQAGSSRASDATPLPTESVQSHSRSSSPPREKPSMVALSRSISSSISSTAARLHPAWAQAFGRPAEEATQPKSAAKKENGENGVSTPSSAPPRPKPKSLGGPSKKALNYSTPKPSSLSQPRRSSRPSTPRRATPSSATEAVAGQKRDHTAETKPKESPRKTKTKGKRKRGKSEPESDEDLEEDVWVVKELLDDRYIRDKGQKVHMYLVRWEGDWPPEQNPTWEPAANIQDENLVVEYRRRKKAGLLKPDKHQKTLAAFMAKQQQQPRYSNVSEAFEDGLSEPPPDNTGIESDSDEPDEELMVTEDTGNSGSLPITPTFESFDAKLQQYKKIFPGPGGRFGA